MHEYGEVGEVVAQAHGVGHVSFRAHAAFVGPDALVGAAGTRQMIGSDVQAQPRKPETTSDL